MAIVIMIMIMIMIVMIFVKSNIQRSVKSNLRLLSFSSTLSYDWSRKLSLLS